MFDRVLNTPKENVTALQESVASSTFFLSQFWIIFRYISSGICSSGSAFTFTVKVKVVTVLLQIPTKKGQL